MKHSIFFLSAAMAISLNAGAADTIVKGGQFMDRILPMEGSNLTSEGIWGCTDVKPRLVDNGLEDNTYSYWGGNIVLGDDGKYHLNVAGWPESSSRGHNTWSSGSMVYHAVSDTPYGPYKNVATIGEGHNPETYRAADGTWVIYVINKRYTCSSLDGPWEESKFVFDRRDRKIVLGEDTTTSLSNITFAKRQDNSFLALDRGGGVWISKDGLQAYRQITDKTVYTTTQRYLEDPVIWRDSLQYHMIVNDWNARIAYYSRSLDGVHWVSEAGTAYQPGVSVHSDGTVENWYKYERPKIYQDELGRAAYLNMAVIDTIKSEDKASDNHSSKNIVMPLNKGLIMEVLNTEEISESTSEIRVRIYSDGTTKPATDINVASLKFGTHSKVNYGNGASATSSEADGDDLIVTFPGTGTGITSAEFAPKMIGQDNNGDMIFGYAKLQTVNYRPALLSALMPSVDTDNKLTTVKVENFGLSASSAATIKVYDNNSTLLATGETGSIDTYGSQTVTLSPVTAVPSGTTSIVVKIFIDGTLHDTNTLSSEAIANNQAALKALVDSANVLLNDTAMTQGIDDFTAAVNTATPFIDRFDAAETAAAIKELNAAIKAFWKANGVSIDSYDFYTWAMMDDPSITMTSENATLTADGSTVTVPIADYVTAGGEQYSLDGRFAIQTGSNYFNLRNKGTDNASSGLFDFNKDSYFAVLNLNKGDILTFKITGEDAYFATDNVYLVTDAGLKAVNVGDKVDSEAQYVVKGEEGATEAVVIKGVHYTTIKTVSIESGTDLGLEEATTHKCTVKGFCGTTQLWSQETDGIAEGSNFSVTARAYYGDADGKYYALSDDRFENAEAGDYSCTATMGTEDMEIEINYEENADIAFFKEAEELAGNSGNATATESATASAGAKAHVNGGKKIELTTLAAGEYTICYGINENRDVLLRNSGSDNTTNEILSVKKGAIASYSFTLEEETALYISGYTTTSGGVNQSGDFDYVLIMKTGDDTGIHNINNVKTNGKTYTLQGIEINEPGEGLYIKNGKKIIISK